MVGAVPADWRAFRSPGYTAPYPPSRHVAGCDRLRSASFRWQLEPWFSWPAVRIAGYCTKWSQRMPRWTVSFGKRTFPSSERKAPARDSLRYCWLRKVSLFVSPISTMTHWFPCWPRKALRSGRPVRSRSCSCGPSVGCPWFARRTAFRTSNMASHQVAHSSANDIAGRLFGRGVGDRYRHSSGKADAHRSRTRRCRPYPSCLLPAIPSTRRH